MKKKQTIKPPVFRYRLMRSNEKPDRYAGDLLTIDGVNWMPTSHSGRVTVKALLSHFKIIKAYARRIKGGRSENHRGPLAIW